MNVGQNIKKYRREIGLTQVEFGKKVGAIQNDVHRWEAGKIIPSLESIKKIAKALNVSVDGLLFTAEERRQLNITDKELLERVKYLEKLGPEDKKALVRLIDAFQSKAQSE